MANQKDTMIDDDLSIDDLGDEIAAPSEENEEEGRIRSRPCKT